MERKLLTAISLLDSYAAADVAVSGNICQIPGLPPIVGPNMKVKAVTAIVGAAETLQKLYITLAATMVAGTRYELDVTFEDEEYEGQRMSGLPIAYDPTTLTGTAATDKHNLYYSLAYKINRVSRFKNKVTAYAITTLAYNTQTANYTVGAILTGATSGSKAVILADTDAGATGTLTLGSISGYSSTFTLAEIIADNNGTPGSATAGAQTLGVRLELRDSAGYYPINGNRGGKTIVYASGGFVQTDVVTNTAAVYAKLTGALIADMVPVKEYTSENLASGYIDFSNLNNQPTSGNTYNMVLIDVEESLSATGMSDATNQISGITRRFGLLLNAGDGDYAATLAAVVARIGV
jgi:hypothetical protein